MRRILLIPCKPFSQSKMRLAGVLDERLRIALAKALFINTLQAVRDCSGVEVLVITGDPEALRIANDLGVGTQQEAAIEGLNAALAAAVASFNELQGLRFAYLPIDLPGLVAQDVGAIFSRMKTCDDQQILITPDSREAGTNFLSWPGDSGLRMCFGPGSFGLYLNQAASLSIPVEQIDMPGLRYDLDAPEDLPVLPSAAHSTMASTSPQSAVHAVQAAQTFITWVADRVHVAEYRH